jgi:hypothetical protein
LGSFANAGSKGRLVVVRGRAETRDLREHIAQFLFESERRRGERFIAEGCKSVHKATLENDRFTRRCHVSIVFIDSVR